MTSRNSNENLIDILQANVKKDLHIHSYFSDGELSPEEIVDKWMSDDYKVIAISDHDGIDGSKVALEYAKDKEIVVVPAIEFDSEDMLGTKLHILGYGVDFESDAMKDKLDCINKWREERNSKLLEAIVEHGYKLTEDEIFEVNGGRFVGKPTFAKALINKGHFSSIDEVFNTLIKTLDKENKAQKKTLQSRDVIDTIHQSNGIAVLAHPIEQKKRGESYQDYLPRLINLLDTFYEYGIDGIECYHPSASDEQSRFLVSYAVNHGLIVTKGSDYHGDSIDRDYSHFHK